MAIKRLESYKPKKKKKVVKITCDKCETKVPNGEKFYVVLRGDRLQDFKRGKLDKFDKAYQFCSDKCLMKFIKKKLKDDTFYLKRYTIMSSTADYRK